MGDEQTSLRSCEMVDSSISGAGFRFLLLEPLLPFGSVMLPNIVVVFNRCFE
jgi:hypothetical protein